MAEVNLNDRVMQALQGFDPCRVENSVGTGMPDICYIGGWIEDKVIDRYPQRATSVVRVPHYVREQRAWHMRHRGAGGRCHVVLEVYYDASVYVFDARDAAMHLGVDWRRAELASYALALMHPWDRIHFRNFIIRCDNDRAGR